MPSLIARIELAPVVLENTGKFRTTIRQCHAVLFRKRYGSFDCAISPTNNQDVLIFVVLRTVQPVIDLLQIFTR